MSTSYSIIITQSAEEDIELIWQYISGDSPDRANEFIAKIEEGMDSLQNYPRRCPIITESEFLGIEYHHYIIGNYRVIFRIENKIVFVMRIFHSSRLLKL